MTQEQLHVLSLRETDVQGALRRCCGNEQLYIACLKSFLDDSTVSELNSSIEEKSWDNAFTAAHALKGLAGNLGFVPLMHATGQLLILIRGGRLRDVNSALSDVNSCYRDISDAINQFLMLSEAENSAN